VRPVSHDGAAKHECDDSSLHVLVDACEGGGLDVESGLVRSLSDEPGFNRLVELKDSAGWFPAAVAADDEEESLVVDDGGGDAGSASGVGRGRSG
jgi:hypothetical protein